MINMKDTIAAISTTVGVGAISIIRISGQNAIPIAKKIFKGKDLQTVPSHTIHYGHIIEEDETIDEVLISIMKAPKTFTTEDVVEINCHGGITTTNRVLELVLRNGARLAEPGEFTKRAFLNGRIDLVKAEAVMDLIQVKSEKARKLAIHQLEGKTTHMIQHLRQSILELLAAIEVNIDYPEYEDIEIMTNQKVKEQMESMTKKLTDIIKESENGKLIREGIKTIIIGRPNVGKSSILNRLLNEERAIVTDMEGTTRDLVEGTINLDGITLNIIDTAGIRETDNKVEKIGVEKSLALIEEATLVIVVLNGNEALTEEDQELLNKTKNKTSIVAINKDDLNQKLKEEELKDRNVIHTNTMSEDGMDALKEKIKELFHLEQLEQNDYNYLTNTRQIALAKESLQILGEVEKGIQEQMPIDMIEIDIKRAWETLGEIIGENYSEELIDQLFSQFCLGK